MGVNVRHHIAIENKFIIIMLLPTVQYNLHHVVSHT